MAAAHNYDVYTGRHRRQISQDIEAVPIAALWGQPATRNDQ
ncbi:MAG: hypothetical protein OXG52_09375 [bacterium]|nr:hypothetical protein [bacterium]